MIKKYFNLPFRSILKQGSQSVISATGLAIALSCCILILLYIQYELSYDKYHKNAGQIYRIVNKRIGSKYLGKEGFVVTAGPLKEALVNEIPEIRYSTKCILRTHIFDHNSSLFEEHGILYTDADFLKIFTFPIISGDQAMAMKEPFTLLITREMALKYFGNEDPIGKTIKADNKYIFTVRGVIENVPKNSHFTFDFITSFETLYSIRGGRENVEKWGTNSYITYIQLIDKIKPEAIKGKLEKLYVRYINPENSAIRSQLVTEPLKGIHLSGNANFEIGKNNDVRYLWLIASIGIFILLIACSNYTNMATARSYGRGREIGVLKIAGISKSGLILQLLMESVLITIAAFFLALIIVWLAIPVISRFTDRPLIFRMIFEYSNLIRIIALMLFVGLFAGAYPALHLSTISPIHLMKSDFSRGGEKRKTGQLRKILVVFQYVISIVALVCTCTVLRQLNFINNNDPGFVKDNILNVYLRDPDLRARPDVLIRNLRENSNVLNIAASADLPVTLWANWSAGWDGKTDDENLNIFRGGIGNDFFDLYKLEIVSGRGFSKDHPSDSLNSLLISQKTAKLLGWNDPIGKKLFFNNNTEKGTVIGVFKDFYFHSLHIKNEPLSFSALGSRAFPVTRYLSIKVNQEKISDTRLFIEKNIKELSPNYLNQVSLLSDQVDEMYSSDRNLATIIFLSTLLAVLLTCLGQYSLSSYTTKKRTKEMALRKVNGAKPGSIITFLSGEVMKLVLIAILFACPVSYFIMNLWLQSFAYRIVIGPAEFIYSILITILISLAVISYHVMKLSRVNPAEMIRYQ
jgi:putative ABC transport system permease protein